MNNCPCCSAPMLRHIRQQRVAWFCRSCWQEMPHIDKPSTSLKVSLEKNGLSSDNRFIIYL